MLLFSSEYDQYIMTWNRLVIDHLQESKYISPHLYSIVKIIQTMIQKTSLPSPNNDDKNI